jgi:putative nucleotidyltransferase with HDIG domain
MNSRSRATAIQAYVAATCAAAGIAICVAVSSELTASHLSVEFDSLFVWLTLAVGLELAKHKLVVGEVRGSIAFIVYMGAVVAFGPTIAIAIVVLTMVTENLVLHRSPIKTVFNVAQHALAISVGAKLYLLLGGPVAPDVADLSIDSTVIPYIAVVVSYFVINSAAVSGAISLSEGRNFVDVWLRNTWALIGYDLVASSLGLGIAWLYLEFKIPGFLGVVVPIVFLRHTYLVNSQLQATNRELLDLMVKAIEARDPYTSGHSQRVSEMARALARDMGLGYRAVENIATAALLHDVGKIYEEFAPLLRKEGRLTTDERMLMETHPHRSAELVHTITNLHGEVEDVVRHHHENYDGTGYPLCLAGDDIPIGSRIVMVADTTDAMTTDRPYRAALPFERVVDELTKYSGSQFDPEVVEKFKESTVIRRIVASRIWSQAARRGASPTELARQVVR